MADFIDPHGTPRNDYDPTNSKRRFRIDIHEHDEEDSDGWKYKLLLTDRKYNDSDGLPIQAVAHGNSWPEAFACAAEFVEQAIASNNCIF
jgi:hypothetical protein